METKIPLPHIHTALTTIINLYPHWETDQQIRETSDGTHHHTTPTPDTLPFGLDKTLNTDTHTATYDGATTRAKQLYHTMCHHTHTPPHHHTGLTALHHCLTLLPLAYNKTTTTEWNQLAHTILRLQEDTEHHSGYTPHTTPYPCLTCHTLLEQPYTNTGRLDIYLCPHCGTYYTPNKYTETATAIAAHTDININVTQQQAATLLNIPLATLGMRIKRAGITPIHGHGRNAHYKLSDIKKNLAPTQASIRNKTRIMNSERDPKHRDT